MKMSAVPPQEDCEPLGGNAVQVAALCWRMHKGHVNVLLITSRETGRWVIPKGWPMQNLSNSAAAAREAWEEAGVEGAISAVTLGQFVYDKILRPEKAKRCDVAVFPLRVKALRDRFPEAKQRRRKWFAAGEAAGLVAEPGLRDLLNLVADQPDLLISPQSDRQS